jgi:hypothetical protein
LIEFIDVPPQGPTILTITNAERNVAR